MSEAKSPGGGHFSKMVQKKVERARVKMMQNLGKADKTIDKELDNHQHCFDKQQRDACRLKDHISIFITRVQALSIASKQLATTINDLYEPEWENYEDVVQTTDQFDALWQNYISNLQDSVAAPLNNYMLQFSDVKQKLAKRGRKLTDYDSARHARDALVTAKKPDENKIAKAEEVLKEAKRTYDELNDNLLSELPRIYNSRAGVYGTTFRTVFTQDAILHGELAKLNDQLSDALENFESENAITMPTTPVRTSVNGESATKSPAMDGDMKRPERRSKLEEDKRKSGPRGPETAQPELKVVETEPEEEKHKSTPPPERKSTPPPEETKGTEPPASPDHTAASPQAFTTPPSTTNEADDSASDEDDKEHSYEVKEKEASLATKPEPGPRKSERISTSPDGKRKVMYQVRAVHSYSGEDDDELSFEAGEVIDVIPYSEPDDQDDGWLMGIKTSNASEGVFPANFTERMPDKS